MEGNSPRLPCKDGTQNESSSKGGPTQKNSCTGRHTVTTTATTTNTSGAVDGAGDVIECSGKYCGSCTAGLIADCVALCCCPCALINIFAFAFVKVPWMVGRKCASKVKRKKKKKKKKKTKEKRGDGDGDGRTAEVERVRDGNMRKRRVEEGMLMEREEEMGGFEAERVWLELYKDGHLGFGRVSFTGIQ